MGVRRTELPFEGQFTQVPNAWARDERLSRKARGLLTEIMSHRVGWHISVLGLTKHGPEGKDAIEGMLRELREAGYLRYSQARNEGGRFSEAEYELCDPATPSPVDTVLAIVESGVVDVTASGFSGHGATASGFSVSGKSAPKEEHPVEDHLEEHDGDAALFVLADVPKGSRVPQPFPDPFIVTGRMAAWAREKAPSVPVAAATEEFVAYWRAGEGLGKKRKNWSLAWMKRMSALHQRNVDGGWKPTEEDERQVIRGGRVIRPGAR